MKQEKISFDFGGKSIGGFLYTPGRKGSSPVVVLVHGFSGGIHETKNKVMCEELTKNGFVAFMFDFYDKPNGLSEIPIEETTVTLQLNILRKAIDFVSALDSVDSNKIGMTGHSLGGMTAVLYAATDPRVKALVVQSAVSNFEEIKNTTFEYTIRWKERGYHIFRKSWGNMKINYSFIGDGLKHDVYAAAERIECPVLVFHGDLDKNVPLTQSEELRNHLKPTDRLEIIKGADHIFKTNNTLPVASKLLIDFMTEKLQ